RQSFREDTPNGFPLLQVSGATDWYALPGAVDIVERSLLDDAGIVDVLDRAFHRWLFHGSLPYRLRSGILRRLWSRRAPTEHRRQSDGKNRHGGLFSEYCSVRSHNSPRSYAAERRHRRKRITFHE